jgi:hypothetical protein
MKKFFGMLAAILLSSAAVAQGASVTTTFTFTSPPSTAVVLTATAPCSQSGSTITCPLPLAAGAQVASIAVSPVGWSGGLSVSPSSPICIGGASPNYTAILCNAGVIGTTSVTITATP